MRGQLQNYTIYKLQIIKTKIIQEAHTIIIHPIYVINTINISTT